MLCQLKREWRESSAIIPEQLSVDPHRRRRHHAFEIDEYTFPLGAFRKFEPPPIGRDELVIFVVEAVPGQFDICMRNDNSLKLGVIEVRPLRPLDLRRMKTPVPIYRQYLPAAGTRRLLRRSR